MEPIEAECVKVEREIPPCDIWVSAWFWPENRTWIGFTSQTQEWAEKALEKEMTGVIFHCTTKPRELPTKESIDGAWDDYRAVTRNASVSDFVLSYLKGERK